MSGILAHIRPGDTIAVGQVLGEPTALVDAVLAEAEALHGIRLFVGLSVTDVLHRVPPGVGLVSTVGMPPNSGLISEGRMELVPAHMSQIPWLLSEGPLKVDVALVLVSPPDVDGWCNLGVTSDWAWHAIESARVVLAEINENVPVVAGDTRVHLDQIAYSINTDRALPECGRGTPSALEARIAEHIAPFVRDGSCIQLGIGKLSEAVLRAVADRSDLGVHSGMVGDTMLEMMRDGIITNRHKAVEPGLSVAGSILGSSVAVRLAAAEPNLRIVSVAQTHDPARIAEIPDFVCINSALEVDLFGQVNSETAAGRYVGATGGGVDFLRASVRGPGGRSLVALPSSTGKGKARIVPRVETVTALATDVDAIATEYGVAHLRGASMTERVSRLIAVAAPEHRDQLRSAASEMGL